MEEEKIKAINQETAVYFPEPLKFRHEYKYYINLPDYYGLVSRLRCLMKPDQFADQNGRYYIRSLYFDNEEDRKLMEKQEGAARREKFRFRFYNQSFEQVKLEKKTKINGLCNKQSVVLTKEACEKILKGETEWMLRSKERLLAELYAKMTVQRLWPKTVSSYWREALVYEPGNVRITIDSQMRTGIHTRDFFSPVIQDVEFYGTQMLLLEVKYDEFFPEAVRMLLQTGSLQRTSFSKYEGSRIYG